DLMRLFGGENIKGLMSRMGMKDGEPIVHPWLNKSIERAQKKVEERNFEVRKHLLEYDDVLNEQRKFIYSRRDEIVSDPDLKQRVISTGDDIFTEIYDRHKDAGSNAQARVALILAELKESLSFESSVGPAELTEMSTDAMARSIREQLRAGIEAKAAEIGEEVFNRYIQFEYLRNIDSRWQDHLENLEALREAVYLRAYSQKNPLLEYKLEGFQIFDDMLYEIKTAIAQKVFRVRIQQGPTQPAPTAKPAAMQASHGTMGQFAAGASSGTTAISASARPMGGNGGAPASTPQAAQVKRTVPKVGRNDPCPCGSGKKYKYCHGR
ncbi:MAG TPA: SEC-C metal-binding domain-containing protein, partial [Spirochaetia bacterium]|nr:SEC-C metal-binding domain-containing protein [Spirochaetia bacterium]